MPTLKTSDFPQANKLDQVGLVAEAVSLGHLSDVAIESFIGFNSDGRQGRYYRRTAELFGLVTTHQNASELTDLGREYVALASPGDKWQFLQSCFAETALMREVLPFVESTSPTHAELGSFIERLYPGSSETAHRRVSSILQYLEQSEIVQTRAGRYRPGNAGGTSFISRRSPVQGLSGHEPPIVPGATTPMASSRLIHVEVDDVKRERAVLTHRRLISAAAAVLRSNGVAPVENRLIDLFCETDPPVLYEMKSVSVGTLLGQVRRAVGQLYEYRYLHGVPDAKLCIVTNWQPADHDEWVIDFLERDRRIAYVWTNDFESFFHSQRGERLLGAGILKQSRHAIQ